VAVIGGLFAGPVQPLRREGILYLVPVLLGIYLLVYFFFGERVPYAGGLGFDGQLYGRLAADLPGVLAQKIPQYYLDRIFPSAVIWLSARALNITLSTPAQIVDAFHIYNSLLIVLAALAWVRIARVLRLSEEAAAVGAACLFLNWLVTKQYLYFVVQTDATALSLGVIAALCVVERRLFALAAVAFAASFAFKLVMPMALLLVVFSRPLPDAAPFQAERRLAAAAAIVAGAIVACAALYLNVVITGGAAQVYYPLIWLSIIVLMAYVYLVARSFPFTRAFHDLRFGNLAPIGFFAALWALREIILAVLAHDFASEAPVIGAGDFLFNTVGTAVAKPGVFLIAHVAACGAGFILLLHLLPRIMNVAGNLSLGAVLFATAALALALNSETRILSFVLPLLVMLLSAALNEIGTNRRFAVVFVAVSFVLARFYLPLNALGMQEIGPGPLTDARQVLQFPWQWFLMNSGPYMAWIGYAVNLSLALAALVVLWFAGKSVLRS